MEGITKAGGARRWRIARWSAVALVLLVPLVAMQFTDEVNWSAGDFMVAAALLVGACGTYELAARKVSRSTYRSAMGVAVVTALLLVWVIGAVGLIGAEGDPFDAAYLGVLAVGLLGATLSGLGSSRMSLVLYAMGLAQAAIAVIALIAGKQHAEASSVGEIVGSNAFFIVLWVWSALLFRLDAQQQVSASDPHSD